MIKHLTPKSKKDIFQYWMHLSLYDKFQFILTPIYKKIRNFLNSLTIPGMIIIVGVPIFLLIDVIFINIKFALLCFVIIGCFLLYVILIASIIYAIRERIKSKK